MTKWHDATERSELTRYPMRQHNTLSDGTTLSSTREYATAGTEIAGSDHGPDDSLNPYCMTDRTQRATTMIIDWSKIDTVLLDMDGTLLDLHFDNYFWLQHLPKRFAELHDQHESQAQTQLQQRFHREKGQLNWYCLDYWSEQLSLDMVTLKREIAHLIAVRPHVEAFLRAVNSSGRRCLLVTNAHRDSVSLKMEQVQLRPWFDAIVISHDYGTAKEQAQFWPRMHNDYNFDPKTTLFIDDTEAVLDAAKAFGIGHLLTLRQPDSRQQPRQNLSYPAFHHFDEIMPPATPCPTGDDDAK
jgi:HAD superfamily hydrolase (TIGR01509 family)